MPRKKKVKKRHHSSHPQVQSLPHSHQHPIMLDDSEPTHHESNTQSLENAEPCQPQPAPEAQQEPQDTLIAPAPPVPEQPVPTPRKNPGGSKRKKPGPGKKRLAEIQEKLTFLNQNLRPVPFAPARRVDVSKHERLFRALRLWDFAHLCLHADIRADLIALLIANYDPSSRRSSVCGKRVAVSRADLARALSLPVKKDKTEAELESFAGDEAVGVVTDFMMNWVLVQEDAWILPKEVVSATQLVKEGQPHRVDWAGLMWTLVERELLEAPKSGECYYASHLQCLIKHQLPELFLDEPKAEPEPELDAEPEAEQVHEPSVELPAAEEEDGTGNGGTTKSKCLEEIQDMSQENHGPGLTLGLGGNTDVMDILVLCKGKEGEQLLSDGKNAGFEHCLRPCSMDDIGSMDCENSNKEEEIKGGKEEERLQDDMAVKFSSLERLCSMDLIQAVEVANNSYNCTLDPYSMPVQHIDPSSGDLLAMRSDTNKNMSLDSGLGGSPLYQTDGKRRASDIDDEEDVHRFMQGNHQQKRMRTDEHWEHATSPFDICMEEIHSWMGKAKMLYAEKEQTCMNARLEIQFLNDMLQQKDHIINSLEKTSVDEQQRRDLEFCRFEHELKVMSRLVLGYKKALRETRSAFAEYRKRFPQGEEPLYKDVPGSGGLVLSSKELGRQHLLEEEMHQAAVEVINSFQKEWFSKFNGYCELILGLSKRLVEINKEVQCVQEMFTQSKHSVA